MRVALLDDYQDAGRAAGDWASLPAGTEVVAFHDHLSDEAAIAERLRDFEVIVGMRERTAFPRSLLARLPNLKLLITTGGRNASFDVAAANEQGVVVCGTGGVGTPTAELAWGLLLDLARHITAEDRAIREGRWQTTLGSGMSGRTLGIVGLGNLGTQVANVGRTFGMNIVAWSPNLTVERATERNATLVTKDELFQRSDYISVHMVLSDRSRGLIDEHAIAQMKPTAFFVNTSRGPIVDEAALAKALREKRIAGAGIDVFEVEPLPADSPFRGLDNVILTPHLGYVTVEGYNVFYRDAVEDIRAFLDGNPVRVVPAR